MNKNDDNLLDELSSLYSGKSNQLILGNRKSSKKKKKQRARKYDDEGIGELL